MSDEEDVADPLTLLKKIASGLPQDFGVYLMKSRVGKILYVGKAKNLRSRVRSYFHGQGDQSPKTRLLVSQIISIDYMVTKSEVEAFLLEASLIKKHRPKYNIRLKDDKAYPYIKMSMADSFPRLYLARKVVRDGALYFGPYPGGLTVRETIRFLNRAFQIRDCTDTFMKSRKRPCLTYEIGRCSAPCVKLIEEKEYREGITQAVKFLRGKNRTLLKDLEKQMTDAADKERFEQAARMRDSIEAIRRILERQNVVNETLEKDIDVISYFGDERGTMIETLHVRQGRVIGSRSHFQPQFLIGVQGEDERDNLISFLNQYYDENVIPDEILLQIDVGGDLTKLLHAVLQERSGREIKVRFPSDPFGTKLLQMAEKNAQEHFRNHVSKSDEKEKALLEIQKKFDMSKVPSRMECFDISNFQGKESVASQVVFEDGVPAREHYRRYKIRTVEGSNDFASMKEVLERRFRHKEYEDPDLLIVDGGKGQLKIAIEVLKDIGRSGITVVGLAKARVQGDFKEKEVETSEERFYLPGRQNPVLFRRNAEALHILTGLRDEAHRFAITYHRKLRESVGLESELDCVVGLGEKRKKTLLKKFESVDDVRSATPEELAELPGFNRVLAERVLLQLNENSVDGDPTNGDLTPGQ